MIPDTLMNYFLASAGAGAALVGLVFVAISLSPKEAMRTGTASQWRAVAGQAFFALTNAFFVSLSALNTGLNLGWPVLVLSLLGLSTSLWLGFPLLRRTNEGKRVWPRCRRGIKLSSPVELSCALKLIVLHSYSSH